MGDLNPFNEASI